MSVALLHAVMTAPDWKTALSHFKNKALNPLGFFHKPIIGRDNNGGPSDLADTPEAAITEAITNALDAMIRHKESLLRSTGATTVFEATRRITEDGDTVFIQCNGGNRNLTVSIGDTGCGMSDEGMLNGVLGIGSNEKPANPLLHGNYGMGGLSNYGQSDAVLFVTREPNAPDYIFTMVWTEELPSGLSSLRFATDAKGKLFRAPAKNVTYITVDRPNVDAPSTVKLLLEDGKPIPRNALTFARLVLAEPKAKLVTLHARGIPSLPEHGTVRRQWGMDMNYWDQRDNDASIYNAFLDRMFGSPATITLMTDGRAKDYTTRHFRRTVLEGAWNVAAETEVIANEIVAKAQHIVYYHASNVMPVNDPLIVAVLRFFKTYRPANVAPRQSYVTEDMVVRLFGTGLTHADLKTTLSFVKSEAEKQIKDAATPPSVQASLRAQMRDADAKRLIVTQALDRCAPEAAHGTIIATLKTFEPLIRLPDQPIAIPIKNIDAVRGTIRVWVLDNGPPEDSGKARAPVGYWLTGHAKGRFGLFITSNGQTHARLPSMQMIRDAGYPFLPHNMIVEVSLDDVPQRLRRHLFVSTRQNMKTDIERDIVAKIVAFLRGCDDDLGPINDRLSPKETTDVLDSVARVNELLRNPLVSKLFTGKSGVQRRVDRYGDALKVKREKGGKLNPWKLEPVPTRMEVYCGDVMPGTPQKPSTFFVTVKTNAADPSYATRIIVTSSDPQFTVVSQPTKLHKGKMRVEMACTAPDGTEATITASMKGPSLTASRDITVRSTKPQHKSKNRVTQSDGNMPNVKVVPITPLSDGFDSLFGMLGEGEGRVDPAFTYHRNPTTQEVTVYVNTEFGPLRDTLKAVEQEDEGSATAFNAAYQTFCAMSVVSALTNPAGPGHAVSDDPEQQKDKHRAIASAAQGFCFLWRLNVIKLGVVNVTGTFAPEADNAAATISDAAAA